MQRTSIAASANTAFNIPAEITGAAITALLGLIIFGSVKRIGKVAEFVVPIMAGAYNLMALVIIAMNITQVPAVFSLIIRSAFDREPAFAGIFGYVSFVGRKKRYLFQRSSAGDSPACRRSSRSKSSGQAETCSGIFSVYKCFVVCRATALMILFTGKYHLINPNGGFLVEKVKGMAIGPEFTQQAISAHFPALGSGFVSIALLSLLLQPSWRTTTLQKLFYF